VNDVVVFVDFGSDIVVVLDDADDVLVLFVPFVLFFYIFGKITYLVIYLIFLYHFGPLSFICNIWVLYFIFL
jgi:hypothetical protein